MLYLRLFWTFFKIGLFTFGGGYAMIPLINAEVIANGWLTQEMLLIFIGISESTPGPFAVNIATFVGMKTGGVWGAVSATTGLVLPSLIIIYIVARFFRRANERTIVKDSFSALRPAVVSLIFYAFFSLALQVLLQVSDIKSLFSTAKLDYLALIIFALLFTLTHLPLKFRGKKIKLHPAFLILLSAGLGMLLYSL